jgi:hypothetical protein
MKFLLSGLIIGLCAIIKISEAGIVDIYKRTGCTSLLFSTGNVPQTTCIWSPRSFASLEWSSFPKGPQYLYAVGQSAGGGGGIIGGNIANSCAANTKVIEAGQTFDGCLRVLSDTGSLGGWYAWFTCEDTQVLNKAICAADLDVHAYTAAAIAANIQRNAEELKKRGNIYQYYEEDHLEMLRIKRHDNTVEKRYSHINTTALLEAIDEGIIAVN